MHTLKVIVGGFLLLGVCLVIGRWAGGTAAGVVAQLRERRLERHFFDIGGFFGHGGSPGFPDA